MVLDNL